MSLAAGLPPAVKARLRALPRGLRDHVRRVREIAGDLARVHGVDAALVDLAAAAHDLARGLDPEAMVAEASRLGMRLHPVERRHPVLIHGAVAARWLQQGEAVSDPEVLEAVRWHTTARREMGPVAKVVFLADKLDPGKAARYPFQDEVRELARHDLDRAILEFLTQDLIRLLQEGSLVHPASVAARNDLVRRLEGRR